MEGPNPSGYCLCGCGKKTNVATRTDPRCGHVAGQPISYIHGHHWRGKPRSEETRAKMSRAQVESWAKRSPEERKREPLSDEQRQRHFDAMPRGESHWSWKPLGSKIEYGHGYVAIKVGPDHPMANSRGYVAEHRLVMAEHIGRPLLPDEDVHHISGDITDNRIENLRIVDHGAHSSMQRRKVFTTAIAALLAAGRTEAEVAEELHMTIKTVRRYKT